MNFSFTLHRKLVCHNDKELCKVVGVIILKDNRNFSIFDLLCGWFGLHKLASFHLHPFGIGRLAFIFDDSQAFEEVVLAMFF